MRLFSVKRVIIVIIIFALVGFGLIIYFNKADQTPSAPVETNSLAPRQVVIGTSVEGRKIEAFIYGNGVKHLIFVGGIHGGYEWNSVLLAYQLIDYLSLNSSIIPKNITVTVIPALNPDGVYKVTGKEGRFSLLDVSVNLPKGTGRLNAQNVDLNRNFACQWQATSTWQNKPQSAGTAVFSEPEARALRDFVLIDKPAVVIFWHSQSNAVYASQCQEGILPETLGLMDVYSKASSYPTIKTFSAYQITGAADDWLASIKVPAFSVELQTHETVEWDKNLAGIRALFENYRNK